MDPDQAASAQARLQHGLITRAQAREFGISDNAIDWRVKTGSWERIQRGVLRPPGAPATWQQGIMAPCLAIPGATASHQDRKSTRLNSSHRCISYAVFCLKKKNC